MTTASADDEFRFRTEEAREFGIPEPLPAIERDTLRDRDGRAVSFLLHGTGAPAVTLLHGAALNAHTWDATAAALERTSIAIDLPGHGSSEWRIDADYRPLSIATAVWSVLEQTGATCQPIVGHSLGGLAAIALAARHPGAVTGLVLVDITPDVGTEQASPIESFLSGPQDFASRDEIVDYARSFGIGVSREAVARGVALNTRVRDDGRVVFTHHLADLRGTLPRLEGDREVLWRMLEALDVPVLLVRAASGFVSDEMARALLERVARARVATIETGHNVQEDDPVGLARLITQFLDQAGMTSSTGEQHTSGA